MSLSGIGTLFYLKRVSRQGDLWKVSKRKRPSPGCGVGLSFIGILCVSVAEWSVDGKLAYLRGLLLHTRTIFTAGCRLRA